MSDYKTTPLKVCASATGGADVDVSATLLVDGKTSQAGDMTMVDVHIERKCVELQAHKKGGEAKVRLLFTVVPLIGNGEFEVTVEFSHPDIPGSPLEIVRSGDAGSEPKPFSKTFVLP